MSAIPYTSQELLDEFKKKFPQMNDETLNALNALRFLLDISTEYGRYEVPLRRAFRAVGKDPAVRDSLTLNTALLAALDIIEKLPEPVSVSARELKTQLLIFMMKASFVLGAQFGKAHPDLDFEPLALDEFKKGLSEEDQQTIKMANAAFESLADTPLDSPKPHDEIPHPEGLKIREVRGAHIVPKGSLDIVPPLTPDDNNLPE